VKRLAQSTEGAIWIAERDRYLVPLRGPKEAGLGWSPEDILFDRDNTLWITASPNGLKRMRFPERAAKALIKGDDPILDDYRERDGLSGDVTTLLFEDREGTIWVGTNKGLDRFRYSRVAGVQLPPQYDQLTLLADKGDVWVGSATNINLAHARDNDVTARPSPLTSCVYREPGGDVWWGGLAAIWRQHGDRIEIYRSRKVSGQKSSPTATGCGRSSAATIAISGSASAIWDSFISRTASGRDDRLPRVCSRRGRARRIGTRMGGSGSATQQGARIFSIMTACCHSLAATDSISDESRSSEDAGPRCGSAERQTWRSSTMESFETS
jgi:hypothetical protein